MKNTTVYGEVVRDPAFKQGQKVGQEQLIAAIDRVFDKRFPVVPNARKSERITSTKRKKNDNRR